MQEEGKESKFLSDICVQYTRGSTIPQLLAEYIQYQYINSTNKHIFQNCWQYISNTNIYILRKVCQLVLGNICKLNVYIGIGYILPTIGGFMSIGGCRVAEYDFF